MNKDPEVLNDLDALNVTSENNLWSGAEKKISVNTTSVGHGIGNVISSFQNKNPELLNEMDSGTFVNIEKTHDHQSFVDVSEMNLFSNKKQVVQFVSHTPVAVPASSNTSNLQPIQVQYSDHSTVPMPTSTFTSQNAFPTNVKSLLSSGLLDGVPVKYIASSCKKTTINGVIKGNGYLCGCDNCKFSEKQNVICALEFERHAACKSSHANQRIYFNSGKSIHAVVQELKKTPPEMLFEAIQNIIGSPINPKNFETFNEYLQIFRQSQVAKNEVAKPF